MLRLFLLSMLTLFFLGCQDDELSSPLPLPDDQYNGESYIDSIPGDTKPVSNLAHAPVVPSGLPALVILLEYDNQTIVSDDTAWAQKIFGYNEHQLNGYYREVSNGKFHLIPASERYNINNDGIVKVHLSRNHINTDVNNESLFYAKISRDLRDAINIASANINFSLYDANGDGAIQPTELVVFFVVAGYEDAFSGYHVYNGIWAHQSYLDHSDAPVVDGVSLFDGSKNGRYAVFGERLKGGGSEYDSTIGVIAHELGHAIFALPDLYNINGDAGGIGIFGLMGAGAWTRKSSSEIYGETPVHMCAWSKSYIGWVVPQELHNTSAALYETTSGAYNVIKIPISANHYYLLENRNKSGYDRGLVELEGKFKGGVLIWHINQRRLTTDYFAYNTVNASVVDKGVDVVEANDPTLDFVPNARGTAKALFYNPNRVSFGPKVTDISAPGSVINLNIH